MSQRRGNAAPAVSSAEEGARGDAFARLRVALCLLLFGCAVDLYDTSQVSEVGLIFPVTLGLIAALYWSQRKSQNALFWLLPALSSGLYLLAMIIVWPFSANHSIIAATLLVSGTLAARELSAMPAGEERERDAMGWLRAATWLLAVISVVAGVQKILYGTYFEGLYLAWNERFDPVLEFLLSEAGREELETLRFADAPDATRLRSPLLVAASAFVWLGEILAGALLLFRRTRLVGLALFIAIMIPTQLAALEMGFVSVMCAMLLAAYEGTHWRRFALVLALIIAASPFIMQSYL